LALRDETLELRPEVSLVGFSPSLPGGAEGLTWTTAGPNRSSWIPPGELEGIGPSSDAAEKVALDISGEV